MAWKSGDATLVWEMETRGLTLFTSGLVLKKFRKGGISLKEIINPVASTELQLWKMGHLSYYSKAL